MLGYPDVISEEALAGLKKYKYSAIDKSPVSKYILQPYWTYVATLFPIWMAPNLITTIGFVLVLANFCILMIYAPFLNVAGPNWIYFSFAVGLWFYSTLDNVDGKQARRTNSSSPLGELFDHGIDALNCTVFYYLLDWCNVTSWCGVGRTWVVVLYFGWGDKRSVLFLNMGDLLHRYIIFRCI
jgi:ethanolaminephosphotransferase